MDLRRKPGKWSLRTEGISLIGDITEFLVGCVATTAQSMQQGDIGSEQ